jgi:hypothetical protein
MNLLKRAVPVAATGSFFLAALFFVAVVWNPASAETTSQEGVVTSLLPTLDKPLPPASRAIALQDDTDQAIAGQPELATELNTWTFTVAPHHPHHFPHEHPHPHPHPHPPHPHHHHPSGFH